MASSLEDLTGLLASFLGERSEQGLTATVGVSGRHVHLSQGDLEALFGAGYELTPIKNLSQPGQFASKETVTLVGPKGVIERVRVLGPVRSQTQVEILAGDSFKLGVPAMVRMSGKLEGTPGITLAGPKGTVAIPGGVMGAASTCRWRRRHRWAFATGRSSRSPLAGNAAAAWITWLSERTIPASSTATSIRKKRTRCASQTARSFESSSR